MLKSLLAGLSLPSRDGRADRGLDEEGEGEWGRGCGLDCPGRPSGIVGPGAVTCAKHRLVLWPARPTAPALCGTNQAPLLSVPVPTLGPLQWGDPAPAALCLAGVRWTCERAECRGPRALHGHSPWFCQVAGVECDSGPSTDAPSTALGTQAPLLSTCCVPGAAGKATCSVVGERLERAVPRLPGSSQQFVVSAHLLSAHCVPGTVLSPGQGPHLWGSGVILGAAQRGCPSLTHMDPTASVSSVSGALGPSGRWPGAGRPCLHPTALASCLADEGSAGPLPLLSVSLFTPLTAAEVAPYVKRLSRGQTVEGKSGGLAPPGPVGPAVGGGLPFCPCSILGPTAALGRPGFSWGWGGGIQKTAGPLPGPGRGWALPQSGNRGG